MTSTNAKRQLPQNKFVGIAVGVGVLLIVLLSIALWPFLRNWRAPRVWRAWEGKPTHSRSPLTRRTSWIGQSGALRYWSADDVGKPNDVQIFGLSNRKEASRQGSNAVVLPTLGLRRNSADRSSKVVVLPLPDLRTSLYESGTEVAQLPSATADVKEQFRVEEGRPMSRRVRTWSKHISLQAVGMSKLAAAGPEYARTRTIGTEPENSLPNIDQGVVTDLDWQEYRQ